MDARTNVPMERVVDDHCFVIEILNTVGPHVCRLQVFTATGMRPAVVATQGVPATGRSLANAAERFAQAAWERHLATYDQPPRWFQHFTSSGAGQWMEVAFQVDEHRRLTHPTWRGSSREEVEQLIGRTVDGGRGDQYTAPDPEPVRARTFRLVRASRLPSAQPFRTHGCMPTEGSARRRWLRRVRPIHSQSCCWYHGGDWRPVLRLVAEVIGAGVYEGVELFDEELIDLRYRIECCIPAGSWAQSAAMSLLDDPVCFNSSGWVNGQHRGQAIIDAGHPHALVEVI